MRLRLAEGDRVTVTTACEQATVRTMCAGRSATDDWFAALSRCLRWNDRPYEHK